VPPGGGGEGGGEKEGRVKGDVRQVSPLSVAVFLRRGIDLHDRSVKEGGRVTFEGGRKDRAGGGGVYHFTCPHPW